MSLAYDGHKWSSLLAHHPHSPWIIPQNNLSILIWPESTASKTRLISLFSCIVQSTRLILPCGSRHPANVGLVSCCRIPTESLQYCHRQLHLAIVQEFKHLFSQYRTSFGSLLWLCNVWLVPHHVVLWIHRSGRLLWISYCTPRILCYWLWIVIHISLLHTLNFCLET